MNKIPSWVELHESQSFNEKGILVTKPAPMVEYASSPLKSTYFDKFVTAIVPKGVMIFPNARVSSLSEKMRYFQKVLYMRMRRRFKKEIGDLTKILSVSGMPPETSPSLITNGGAQLAKGGKHPFDADEELLKDYRWALDVIMADFRIMARLKPVYLPIKSSGGYPSGLKGEEKVRFVKTILVPDFQLISEATDKSAWKELHIQRGYAAVYNTGDRRDQADSARKRRTYLPFDRWAESLLGNYIEPATVNTKYPGDEDMTTVKHRIIYIADIMSSVVGAIFGDPIDTYLSDRYPRAFKEKSLGDLRLKCEGRELDTFDVTNWDTKFTLRFIIEVIDSWRRAGLPERACKFLLHAITAPIFTNKFNRYETKAYLVGVVHTMIGLDGSLPSGAPVHVPNSSLHHAAVSFVGFLRPLNLCRTPEGAKIIYEMLGDAPTGKYPEFTFTSDDEIVYQGEVKYKGDGLFLNETPAEELEFVGYTGSKDIPFPSNQPLNFLLHTIIRESDAKVGVSRLAFELRYLTYWRTKAKHIEEVRKIFEDTLFEVLGLTLDDAFGPIPDVDLQSLNFVQISQLLEDDRLRWMYGKEDIVENDDTIFYELSVQEQEPLWRL